MKKEDAFERVAGMGAEQIATKFSEAQLVEIWEALYSSTAPFGWTKTKLAEDLSQYWRVIARAWARTELTNHF